MDEASIKWCEGCEARRAARQVDFIQQADWIVVRLLHVYAYEAQRTDEDPRYCHGCAVDEASDLTRELLQHVGGNVFD